MHALVVYESMYGATRQVAESMVRGLTFSDGRVTLRRLSGVRAKDVDSAELLVVGGPTHVRTILGLRDWIPTLGEMGCAAAAFDTRVEGPPLFTGRASKRFIKLLHDQGCRPVAPPESFLVDTQGRLVQGELERAWQWGVTLAAPYLPAVMARGR